MGGYLALRGAVLVFMDRVALVQVALTPAFTPVVTEVMAVAEGPTELRREVMEAEALTAPFTAGVLAALDCPAVIVMG